VPNRHAGHPRRNAPRILLGQWAQQGPARKLTGDPLSTVPDPHKIPISSTCHGQAARSSWWLCCWLHAHQAGV